MSIYIYVFSSQINRSRMQGVAKKAALIPLIWYRVNLWHLIQGYLWHFQQIVSHFKRAWFARCVSTVMCWQSQVDLAQLCWPRPQWQYIIVNIWRHLWRRLLLFPFDFILRLFGNFYSQFNDKRTVSFDCYKIELY